MFHLLSVASSFETQEFLQTATDVDLVYRFNSGSVLLACFSSEFTPCTEIREMCTTSHEIEDTLNDARFAQINASKYFAVI